MTVEGMVLTDRSAPPTRTMVLWVPDWPVVAAVEAGLAEVHQPVAVHDGRVLTVVSAMARARGVRRGMRRRHAQQVCPELVLVPAEEGRDVRAFEAVAAAVETVVVGVEVARAGLLLLPAQGATRYHGSEHVLAERLVSRLVEVGHECQVGVADGLLGAVLAARDGVSVPAGESAQFLAPRPVDELVHVAMSARAVQRVTALVDLLHRLGVHTLGELVALPTADVLARFGALGAWAQRLAGGGDVRGTAVRRSAPDLEVECDLDPPADRVDVAAFAARRLAEQLHALLMERGMSCGRLRIMARTEAGDELVRSWRTVAGAWGGVSAARITERVRWQLEGWLSGVGRDGTPEPAPLVRLGLRAEEVGPVGAEQDLLWGGASGADSRARRALHRVQGLLGADGVLTAMLQGGRDARDQVHLVPWGEDDPPPRPADQPWPGALPPPAPAVVLGEPAPVELVDAAGRVVQVSVRLTLSAPPAALRTAPSRAEPDIGGTQPVRSWAGPWPMVERWWAPDGRRRVHLQVVLGDGRAVLLAFAQGRWTLEARYD